MMLSFLTGAPDCCVLGYVTSTALVTGGDG